MKKILSICAVLLVAATAMGQNRYGIKSGSYKTEMDMMGQTITNTTYFDDYGAKEVTEMEMMGMQMTQITKDGVTYIVNKGDKSVQEIPTRSRKSARKPSPARSAPSTRLKSARWTRPRRPPFPSGTASR